jgi:hypothetical protein
MKFDVSLFSQLEKKEFQAHFNSELDISSMKLFYDNCIRMGGDSNSNIQIATIHPDIWFGDHFELLNSKIKMVVESPVFQLVRIEGGQLVCQNYSSDQITFSTDQDLINFFEHMSEFGSLAVFSLVKYLDVRTLQSYWNLRYKDISTKEEIRDKKISSII